MHAGAVLVLLLATAAAETERPYDFREKRLENGLVVLTLERHSCPIATVQVWYHVGSKDESPERQGFAHLFEHMMFRGTDRVPSNTHAELIRSVGGSCNAFTGFDTTCFVNELPANQVELGLWLEAERMAFLRIDEQGFDTERMVVEEERRGMLNKPYGRLSERVLAGMYREHPYRWATIGNIPHLRAATLEEVEAFWAKYYLPNNAVLVIAGDIEHEKAQALAERYFGWIPRGADAPRTAAIEPPQEGRRDLRVPEEIGTMPIVAVVVPAPPFGHRDSIPLRLLSTIVAENNGRLYHDLMWADQVAHNVYPFMTTEMEDSGLFGAAAQLKEESGKEKAMSTLEAHLDRLMHEPVKKEELEAARRWLLRGEAQSRCRVSGVAWQLGYTAAIRGDAEVANDRIEALHEAETADLLRVAREYLGASKRTRIRVEPTATGIPQEEAKAPAMTEPGRVAKRTGVKAGLARPDSFPRSPPLHPPLGTLPVLSQERRLLENGLEVVVVPDHDVPLVTCDLAFRFGAACDREPGTAYFTMSMLRRVTARTDSGDLLERCIREALKIDGGAEHDDAHLSTTCLPDQVDTVLGLFAEMVRYPSFDAAELEPERDMMMRWLPSTRRNAATAAGDAFARILFDGHPYGRAVTGEIEDMRTLEPKDLEEWWKRYGRPDVAVLYVAGDVTPDAVFRIAKAHFGEWRAEGPAPEHTLPPAPKPAKRQQIVVIDRPGSTQSEIRVGQVSLTHADPDWAGANLLGRIVGGGPTSRVATHVREQHGLAYAVDAWFQAKRLAGVFEVGASTDTARTAQTLRAVLDVLASVREVAPTEEEIEQARNIAVGSLAGRWETADAVVEDLWLADSLGLPQDHVQRMLAAFDKLQRADLLRIARKYIDPDKLVIVVVGDASRIRSDLERFGPVRVE